MKQLIFVLLCVLVESVPVLEAAEFPLIRNGDFTLRQRAWSNSWCSRVAVAIFWTLVNTNRRTEVCASSSGFGAQ